MEKRKLRTLVRQSKQAYSPDQLRAMSLRITEPMARYLLRRTDLHTILLYHSLPDEVCTAHLIDQLLAHGRRVVLPTVVGNDLELHIYDNSTGTHSGYQGIIESDGPVVTDYTTIDLAVIPGMAFTKRGDRLGRGRGYYDRLLPHLQCPLIGLAFPFQLYPTLPTEPHDIMMHYVVS